MRAYLSEFFYQFINIIRDTSKKNSLCVHKICLKILSLKCIFINMAYRGVYCIMGLVGCRHKYIYIYIYNIYISQKLFSIPISNRFCNYFIYPFFLNKLKRAIFELQTILPYKCPVRQKKKRKKKRKEKKSQRNAWFCYKNLLVLFNKTFTGNP